MCIFRFIQNPLGNDMVLKLSDDGIRLMFDPYTQRLKVSNDPVPVAMLITL